MPCLPRSVSNSVYPLSRLNPLAQPFFPRNLLNSIAPAHPPSFIIPACPLSPSIYPFSRLNPYYPYANPFFPQTHPFYISLAPAPLLFTPTEPPPFITSAKLSSASAKRLFPIDPLSSATAPAPPSLLSTQSKPPTFATSANISSLSVYPLSRWLKIHVQSLSSPETLS